MARTSKRINKIREALNAADVLSLEEGISKIKENATAKFDETLEIIMNLNVDSRKSDQALRGMVALPHGTGRTVRVAVFAIDKKADEAKAAGADIVGSEELVKQIKAGKFDFDLCIATPDMMALVGQVGKILGPKGLMPNPKLGTVTNDVGEAVKAAKKGQVEFRTEKAGIVQAGVGKVSFNDKALVDNVKAFADAVLRAKPSGVKGSFLKSVYLSSTMGVSVKVSLAIGK